MVTGNERCGSSPVIVDFNGTLLKVDRLPHHLVFHIGIDQGLFHLVCDHVAALCRIEAAELELEAETVL